LKTGLVIGARGGLIRNQLVTKQVPINFETVNGEHRVTVSGLLEVATERIPNPMPGQLALDTKVSDIAVPLYSGPVNVPAFSFELGRVETPGRKTSPT
jgi:hypothetical protein